MICKYLFAIIGYHIYFIFSVFLDADKKVYRQYLDLLLGVGSDANGDSTSACMLTDGATVVIDNTLWKGLVVAQVTFFVWFSKLLAVTVGHAGKSA